ncbi:GNAT family N-acetyltransferase [Aquimarina brevivitae]|uniref:Spermine/spermidine N-acetyltransferase n=1 Tax=Aquimarina brevivitae TaxID=323412 RepID=A0A4Q7P3G1_9FLAO|nr:GNAT family N-acetyltransferase [Aquimarina brevivitae]RZS93918.1 spermine/spermidine N-acetyltransferase [Aquimarina brevivitae]
MLQNNEISLTRASIQQKKALYDISRHTFYESYGPPLNTERNIQHYISEHLTLEKLASELQNPNVYYFLLTYSKEVIGYLKLNIGTAQTEHLGNSALEIERIYIKKEFQGNQLGQLLIEKAKHLGRQLNKHFVWLGVWDQNRRAIQFYKRAGFIPFSTHTFTLGDDVQTDIMMKLMLA